MKVKKGNVFNKNCLDVMNQWILKNKQIDLIITDPPYKTTPKGSTGTTGGMLKKEIVKRGDMFKHNSIKPQDYAPLFFSLLKDGGHCYVMTNHTNLVEMLNTFESCGFKFIKSLIWNKGNKIMGRFYMSQFEYILFFRKGKGVQINNCGTSDIIDIPNKKTKGKDGKNIHDTEKPVNLMKILIENSSQKGEVVCDPFFGVGSTWLACEETNRKFVGCELDKEYFDIACNRINNMEIHNK